MKELKNGEWWLCERGGVKTVFLRKDDEWRSDERDAYSYCDVVPLFKMIEDKPSYCAAVSPKRTRTEYEKVTESIFDLRDEFERGELYRHSYGFRKIETLAYLGACCQNGNIFKKVEKEIDWRKDADSYFLKTKYLGIDCTIEEAITRSDYCNEFLELCRVALRANGELD
ncbi:hypothetical protein [Vibrio phage vB_VaS_L1]|nr:hypothetical protein [Vibrio phage vB_VaS_L1]